LRKRLHNPRHASPTLGDVAKAAGVSTATVSRVINQPDAVREAMRRRVEAQINALGYVPDGAARALASRRSRTIGAVIPTLASAIFAGGIHAFEAKLDDGGHSLILATSGYDAAQEIRHVQNLVERGIDGLLLVGKTHDPAIFSLLNRRAVPYVETYTSRNDGGHPFVGFDNRHAAYRMARHLIDLGHREFAMVAGITAGNDRAAERVQGVREALDEHSIPLPTERFIECPYDIPAGRRAVRRLLAAATPPSAIICGNDVLAIGGVLECQATSIDIPGRVSITGFDDLPLAGHLTPGLTTMHVPSGEMGRKAAAYLLSRLHGDTPEPATILDVDLIARGSTGPSPGRQGFGSAPGSAMV